MPLPVERSTKLWLALLHEIDRAGGAAAPASLYPKVRAHFPEITEADAALRLKTGGNAWTNRVQWARNLLAQRGCIARGLHGLWPITPLGKKWLDANWRGDNEDCGAIPQPPVLEATERSPSENTAPVETPPSQIRPPRRRRAHTLDIAVGDEGPPSAQPGRKVAEAPTMTVKAISSPPAPAPLSSVAGPIEQLCRDLEVSQRLSSNPRLFEQHVTAAFASLGFAAIHIGGSGETDVYIRADLGPRSYSAVIDAKTTRYGRAIDSQINFPAIEAHRKGRQADFIAVVGEDFSHGQLQTFADQNRVTLITTEMLIELLRLHHRIPFTLLELQELFATTGRAGASMQVLRERHQQHAHHWTLLAEIIDTIDTIGRYAPPKVDNLWCVLLAKAQSTGFAPTTALAPKDVEQAVAFLASRAMHVLEEVPGSNGAYQLVVSPAIARQRMAALARFTSAALSSGAATAPGEERSS